jgi:branched-chain amino acid transport system ATP-binding protein
MTLPDTASSYAPPGRSGQTPLVKLVGVKKYFPITRGIIIQRKIGQVHAVDGVDLEVYPGETLGLVGETGCGKSTLARTILRAVAASSGHIVLDGRDITAAKPHRRARLGIGRTFQRLETFGTLSTRDNVLVAAEMRRRWSHERGTSLDLGVDEIIDRVGLRDVAAERVDQLPTGMARLVELARALASQPRVLLLDEPASGLIHAEIDELDAIIRVLAREMQIALMVVEHRLELLRAIADEVIVLDVGRRIAGGLPEAVFNNPDVRAAYFEGAGT